MGQNFRVNSSKDSAAQFCPVTPGISSPASAPLMGRSPVPKVIRDGGGSHEGRAGDALEGGGAD